MVILKDRRTKKQANLLKPNSNNLTELSSFIITSLMAICFFCLPYFLMYFYPIENIFYLGEDCLIEDGTFLVWFLAFCLLSGIIIHDRQYRRIGYFVIAIGCIFVAMEEISWGQRILHFNVPDIIKQVNRQGEVTLHNSIYFPIQLITIAILFWTTLFPILIKWNSRLRDLAHRCGIPIVPLSIRPFFWLGAFVNLSFIDYDIAVPKAGEWQELYFGFAVLVFAVDIFFKRQCLLKRKLAFSYLMAPFTSILIFILITVLVQELRGTKMEIKSAYLIPIFSNYYYPERKMYKQAIEVYQYAFNKQHLAHKMCRICYAEVLLLIGRSLEAYEVLDIALKEEKESLKGINDTVKKMITYLNIGKIQKLKEYNDEAENSWRKAIRIGKKEITSGNDFFELYFSLGKIYFAKGDHIMANENFKTAQEIAPNEVFRKSVRKWRRREIRKYETQYKSKKILNLN